MAITGTPVQTAVSGAIVCSDLALVEPGTVSHEGCPLLTRQRVAVVDKGVLATIRWEMRNRAGAVVDLSACLSCDTVPLAISESLSVSESEVDAGDECGSVAVRIGSCDEVGTIYEVTGTADTPSLGLVRFALPEQVYSVAGIWRVQLAILDGNSNPVFLNTGLISVERGLFGDLTAMTGPPTLNEIRLHIRDTAVENDLLMDVEFDDDEIVAALIYPIQYWNETPPNLRRYHYTCATFPWRKNWLDGTVARLLRTGANWYMRNKLQASHGGVQLDDRSKNREYMQMAMQYQEEFENWVLHKKVQLNAGQMMGTLGSPYN
jgi:hypothetical protein